MRTVSIHTNKDINHAMVCVSDAVKLLVHSGNLKQRHDLQNDNYSHTKIKALDSTLT